MQITDAKKIKKNKGFVILFAVTLSAILLAIALGVANIAQKEIRFGTSAKDTNDSFVAADTGAECALFYDKLSGSSFPVAGPATAITCATNTVTPTYSGSANTGSYSFTLTSLGSSGVSCAKVNIFKDQTTSPIKVTITSDGYDIGDSNCNSTNPFRVERELKISSLTGAPPNSTSVVISATPGTVSVGQPSTIHAIFTDGAGDTITNTTINIGATSVIPYSSSTDRTYIFTPSSPGDTTFLAYAQTVNHPTWTVYGQITVHSVP